MSGLIVVDTQSLRWDNGLAVIARMTPEFARNLGPEEQLADAYAKFNAKTLFIDPTTTRRLDLVNIEPGYADLTDAYHDSVEECLFLEGDCTLSGEGEFSAGDYFWRPPGWVHGAKTRSGFRAILMMEGIEASEQSGPVTRRIRPTETAGTNSLTSDPDTAIGPRGWVRCLHTDLVAWQPGPLYARTQGELQRFDLDHAAFKHLSSNPYTGAQTVLMRLDSGFEQPVGGRHTATVRMFVISGSFTLGNRRIGAESYVQRPALLEQPPMKSEEGALVFLKASAWLDFAASA